MIKQAFDFLAVTFLYSVGTVLAVLAIIVAVWCVAIAIREWKKLK